MTTNKNFNETQKKTNFQNVLIHILLLFILILFANYSFAQMKVNNLGKTFIGLPTPFVHDADNILSATILGAIGDYRAGSKLAFGDFGRLINSGGNVFIGEYGTADSDQLWLHGKQGLYFTRSGQANDIVAYCYGLGNDAFYFNTKVYSKSVILSSDARFKSNIKQIETPLSKLLSVRGVSYDFSDKLRKDDLLKKHNDANIIEFENPIEGYELSEKEIRDMEEYEAYINQEEIKEHKLGFIAQELQEIFPDLVKEDDLGYLGIDYIGLIPVIVEAMKEQQTIIESLQYEINVMKDILNDCCSGNAINKSMGMGNENIIQQNAENNAEMLKVFQNRPNPFNEVTTIKCYVPKSIQKAELCIYDMNGTLLKCIVISERKTTDVQIQAGHLAAGIYIYLLIGDGKASEAKQMIITK